MRRLTLIFVVCVLAATQVQAKEVVGVDIITPGSTVACSVDSTPFLNLWTDGNITTPLNLDSDPYQIRLLIGHDSEVVATNIYHYYPSSPGYVLYADVENGWSTAEGTWFSVDDEQLTTLLQSACAPLTTLDYLAWAVAGL